jgi:hypothetical protein
VKKTRTNQIKQLISFIIPTLACFYAQGSLLLLGSASVSAQESLSESGKDASAASGKLMPTDCSQGQSTARQSSEATPALNIIPTVSRPPLPPPPETPQAGQAIILPHNIQPSMPQAWRIKALQLFKANSPLDKNSIVALRIHAGYANAFEAIAKALANSGISVEALSFSSGHMLLSCQNERGLLDKAIIALRQAAPDSDSSASSGTDVRVFCDSHNHSLTLAQVKAILGQVDSSVENSKNKPGAETL